jgi:hypothetical protein
MLPGASIYLLCCLTEGLAGKLLPGWRSALNHHPALVHFPIALWLAALIHAKNWHVSADERTALVDSCLSEICRQQFGLGH